MSDHSDIGLTSSQSDIISDIGLTFLAVGDIRYFSPASCGVAILYLTIILNVGLIQNRVNLYQISQFDIRYQSSG